jgi:hypothetical protein
MARRTNGSQHRRLRIRPAGHPSIHGTVEPKFLARAALTGPGLPGRVAIDGNQRIDTHDREHCPVTWQCPREADVAIKKIDKAAQIMTTQMVKSAKSIREIAIDVVVAGVDLSPENSARLR